MGTTTTTSSSANAKSAMAVQHFLSGLGSGVASAVLLQPLDLLKTRTQQSGRLSLLGSWKEVTQSPHPIRALWRGTVPSSLRTGIGSAIYFSSLHSIREFIQRSNALNQRIHTHSTSSSSLPKLTNTANVVAGAVARTWAGFVLMPLTVIKVRFESSLYSYPSMWAAVKDIHHQAGIRGFFSGFGATAIRDAPYAGMYVSIYEMLKRRLGSFVSQDAMTPSMASSVNFASAISAGAICSAISNPIDVCKTRIQLQPDQYRNLLHAGYRMVTEEGLHSLWRGLVLRMSRKALSSALSWTIYEELIRRYAGSYGARSSLKSM
ncbi:uncharacterized protein TrAFT101_007479 [Trichoderma asperellum]|nr:hypothetical protein TrAFT101_007479 [Trichoderma asperellum]